MSWQYIAGFFDGEGCLHAVGPVEKSRGRFRVTIAQSLDVGRETLEEIALFLNERGISAYVLAHKHSKERQKPHWRQVWNLWITQQASIVAFIEGVFPYIRIKRQRAEDYRRLCIMYPPAKGLTIQDEHSKISREEMRALFEAGVPLSEIAILFGMDYSSVWIKAKRMKLPVDSTGDSNRRRAKVPLSMIIDLFKETGSYQEVGRRLRIPPWNVRNRLIKNGVEPNAPGKRGRKKGHVYSPVVDV